MTTSAIDPYRTPYFDPTPPPGDPAPGAPPPTKPAAAPRDTTQAAAALPDTQGALLARAASTATARAAAPPQAHPLLAMGIDAEDAKDVSVRHALDAFRATATATYHVPGEGDVTVPAPFRLQKNLTGHVDPHSGYVIHEKNARANAPVVAAMAARLGIRDVEDAHAGRGAPATVTRLTQELIDTGHLPRDGRPLAERVRTMMVDHGLGFDCAGYVQQAFLGAHGVTRAQAHFATVMNESLSNLPARGFTKVAPEGARPGDVIALDPAKGELVGHRLVVYSCAPVSSEETARANALGASMPSPGKVFEIKVDSSFGSGGNPAVGGVQRRTWLYDTSTRQWAEAPRVDPRSGKLVGPFFRSVAPGGDTFNGVYRAPSGS